MENRVCLAAKMDERTISVGLARRCTEDEMTEKKNPKFWIIVILKGLWYYIALKGLIEQPKV